MLFIGLSIGLEIGRKQPQCGSTRAHYKVESQTPQVVKSHAAMSAGASCRDLLDEIKEGPNFRRRQMARGVIGAQERPFGSPLKRTKFEGGQ
jgi:hypothetical protein